MCGPSLALISRVARSLIRMELSAREGGRLPQSAAASAFRLFLPLVDSIWQALMIRLRDITIRTRLRALVLISTVGMAAVLCLAACVLHWYRVEGPVHKDLQEMRGLLTEMEPSLLALARPHLIVEGLAGDNAIRRKSTASWTKWPSWSGSIARAMSTGRIDARRIRPSSRPLQSVISRPTSTSAWSRMNWRPRCAASSSKRRRRCSMRRSILAMPSFSRHLTMR